MELLSQFLYSENIFSTVIGSHLDNSRHFEKKKQVANGFYQTNILRGVPMPTFMLVPQSERFFLNIDLIGRAIVLAYICIDNQCLSLLSFGFSQQLFDTILVDNSCTLVFSYGYTCA